MLKKAVFLDPCIIMAEGTPSKGSKGSIQLIEKSVEGLKTIKANDYLIIFASNQPRVASGQGSESALGTLEMELRSTLSQSGLTMAGFYYCPHQPDGKVAQYSINCFCRKPRPGMLFKAGREHELSLAESWIIGSRLDDIEAGRRAECYTVLINNSGRSLEWNVSPFRRPHHMVTSFQEAAALIPAAVRPYTVSVGQSAPAQMRQTG